MKTALLTGLLLLLVAQTGCQTLTGLTPEQAARQAILDQRHEGYQLDEQTVRVLQSQPWGEGRLVMIAFQQVEQNGPRVQCLDIFEVSRQRGSWRAGGGNGGCGPVGTAREPLDVNSGANQGGDQIGYSHVMGLVSSPEVAFVEILWEDDHVQRVLVINASYLAAREGVFDPNEVRALDEEGKVIDTFIAPQDAPGKIPD